MKIILHSRAGSRQLHHLSRDGIAINYLTGRFAIDGTGGKIYPYIVPAFVGLLHGFRTHAELHEALYGDREDGGPSFKDMQSALYTLRNALEPFNITIENLNGVGWRLLHGKNRRQK